MLGTDLRSSTGGTPIIARRNKHDVARRYGLAILAAIVALLLRELLTPFLGENNPYHTVWAAVVFSAWYCGLGSIDSDRTVIGGRHLVLVLASGP